ncbi:MAG TPA: polysaccharide biosynthesis/export family protein [Terriglobia bacterium]|nr:polysaccharide biosynthesis/export family protein [Terriglobia bacterium]
MYRKILLRLGIAVLVSVTGLAYAGQNAATTPAKSSGAPASGAAVKEILTSLEAYGKEAPAPALEHRNPRYEIERGDALKVNFTFTPEYNESVSVQPDGYISLVGLPDMYVLGQTTPELTETLKTAYAKLLHDPALTVTLTTFEKPYFTAFGMVSHPGKYDLKGDTTLTQGIALAGGFTDKEAKDSQVLVFRRVSNDWVEARKINVKQMLRAGNLSEDLDLQPGDMIFVPKNRLSKLEPYLPYLIPLQAFRANVFFNGGVLY